MQRRIEDWIEFLIPNCERREMLMNSPIYNEWVQEERKEAAEEAAEKATKKTAINVTRQNILDLLQEKFDIIC